MPLHMHTQTWFVCQAVTCWSSVQLGVGIFGHLGEKESERFLPAVYTPGLWMYFRFFEAETLTVVAFLLLS